MITIGYKVGECLSVVGHAGFADPGQDIVCAGISALYCTLRAISKETVDEYIDGTPAHRLHPACEGDKWAAVADLIAAGMKAIADQHPDNVSYLEGIRVGSKWDTSPAHVWETSPQKDDMPAGD